MQESFGSLEMSQRVKRDSSLMKAHRLIDWERLRPLLKGLYKRELSQGGGQQPIDPLLMFKATLLGPWHSLSDPKLEEALLVRIDFMHFCGLGLADSVPDETTLCRFRNRLIHTNKLTALLRAVNVQLQGHGLMVAKATGAVIDATLITSAARPRSERIVEIAENETENEAPETELETELQTEQATEHQTQHQTQPQTQPQTDHQTQAKQQPPNTPEPDRAALSAEQIKVSEQQSVDPDATWVKKGKRSHFGFRTYASVDSADGYIRGVHTAPANQSETTHFEAAVESSDFKPERVYADKGFSSKANRARLKARGIKSAIMHKGQRNTPITERQKRANKLISKVRYIVEQGFGTLKRGFNMSRASYMGTEKVNAQFTLKAMCFNLLKAARKISLLPEATGVVRLRYAN